MRSKTCSSWRCLYCSRSRRCMPHEPAATPSAAVAATHNRPAVARGPPQFRSASARRLVPDRSANRISHLRWRQRPGQTVGKDARGESVQPHIHGGSPAGGIRPGEVKARRRTRLECARIDCGLSRDLAGLRNQRAQLLGATPASDRNGRRRQAGSGGWRGTPAGNAATWAGSRPSASCCASCDGLPATGTGPNQTLAAIPPRRRIWTVGYDLRAKYCTSTATRTASLGRRRQMRDVTLS